MKAKDLRDKTVEELTEMKTKLAREIMDAGFKDSIGQLSDKSVFAKKRKDIARINTVIGEK